MTRGDISTTGVLNAAVPHLRRVGAPATGILLLTALPLRLLEIHYIDLLHRLRNDAPHYGNLLTAVAALGVASFVLSLYGRAVFMRACLDTPRAWRDLLRVDRNAFLAYVYVALMIEVAFVLLGITVIVIPIVIMLTGVAAAASTDAPQPGLVTPLRNLAPYLRHGRVLTGLLFVFAIAYIAVAINFSVLAKIIVWAAGVIPGFSSIAWSAALTHSFRLNLAIFAASATAIEPFFLAAMHVYGDRVRSRQSGDDLIRRFRALTVQKAAAAMIVVATLAIPAAARAQERTVTTADYVSGLRVVRDALAAGRYAEAKLGVDDLQKVEWVASSNRTRFEPDRALLRSAGDSASAQQADLATTERLTSTIDAFGTEGPRLPRRASDAALLARIRDREKTGELMRGGELKNLPQTSPSVAEEIRRMVTRVIEWLAEKLEWLFDWIARLWPKARDDDDESREFIGVPLVVWIVTSLVVAIVALLAVSVLRRSKRRAVLAQSQQIAASERDADPLSRESNEWERYAAELAAGGRLREAIRAWYHAVLVTLYRSGILHYRKGVTNWEYIAALSPALEWRPQFVSMTRRFDREWYGQHDTTPDVLDACASDARAILETMRQGGR